MKMHPNVKIKQDIQSYADHHSNLAKHLAAQAGADDIEAIEVGYIAQFKAQPQNFYNLNDFGADKMKSQWLDWKWAQSLGANNYQIGLGTDVGSLGLCYRRDLFKQAGLPTDRNAVSKLWPDWAHYLAAGKKYEAKAPANTHFFDSGSNIFNAIINQDPKAYYDNAGNVIVKSNPAVKNAWNTTIQMVQAGESAGLAAFTEEWNTGFKQGSFATVTCPAWMMAYIQDQAPKTKGKWDIASVPGGGGNWGGSFLALPKQGKHPKEAYDLAKFLTSPASELYIFKKAGNLPSEPALYKTPAMKSFKNPFFNNAPVGKIYTTAAVKLQPQITGAKTGDIQTAASNAIQRVEQKKQSPDQSWAQFLKDVDQIAS
jgi:cellobiose transport system substrate-binding protein